MDRSTARDLRRIDSLLNTRGRPLSEADRGFVLVLMRELEQFQSQAPKDRALMFHPLSGYQRYLIHRVTEIYPKLSSFTIDTDDKRRTVVCFKSKRKEQQMQHGHIPPQRGSSSRGSPAKESKLPRASSKVKSNGPSPVRGRSHHSEPESRSKLGKYNTISNDAVKKRQRGLTLEGPVVNGEQPKSDIEDTRRKGRPESRKKHRTKRSLSQPHLNDKRESRRRKDSFGGSTDNQNSDLEMSHKPRHAKSATNIPDKRRPKSRKKETMPVERTEPVMSRHGFDEIYQSSGPESSHQANQSPSDNEENEIPPSYEKMSQEAKEKAMRNLMRIKRTNSTKSCPPLEQPKHDYVNSKAALSRMENHDSSYNESPVFHRKQNDDEARQNDSAPGKKTKDRSKKKKRTKNKESDGTSREYVNIPKEVRRQDSYESSPFDSSWHDNPEPANCSVKEVAAVIEKVPSLNSIIDTQVDSVTNDMKELPGNLEDTTPTQPLSSMVSLGTMNDHIAPINTHIDKETQTDLHGSLVDKMTSAYNASLNSVPVEDVIPPTSSNESTHPGKPSMTNLTSGTSTPNASSSALAYEKLGEYMFKAVMNFQNMLAEGQAVPQPQEFRIPTGTDPFRTPAVYPPMAHPTQPVLVPWMPPFYADPIATRPQVLTCASQPLPGEHCCHHQSSTTSLIKERSRSKRGSFTSVSSRDDGSHHKSHRSRPSTGRIPNHIVSDHTHLVSKKPDAFDSDASSEITNPELTMAEGGDGLMVYVRNSNRSTSSAAGSVADASNIFPEASEDARASPLGHDNDDVFKKLPKPKSSSNAATNTKNAGARNKSKKPGKKSSSKNKPAVENEVDPIKEIVPLPVDAPLAKMDDEWSSHSTSSSSTSRRSSLLDRESESPAAEIARSLVGEDLDPVVCFDDNLEMACEDGTAEH